MLYKYPRTRHLEGSRLQPGDEDLEALPFDQLAGRQLVIEEKIDGANAGISFSVAGELLLQSRGHYLTGGPRERHFDLFKTWAQTHRRALRAMLGARYVMYGEWCYAKHTVFYDRLPHYFLEFDLLDRERGCFLSTPRREALLDRRIVAPVPVLCSGPAPTQETLVGLVGPSLYKSERWREDLVARCEAEGLDVERAWRQTDPADESEGLYIKVEEQGRVVERLKYVRAGFLSAVLDADGHWLARPILPNGLAPDVDLFSVPADEARVS